MAGDGGHGEEGSPQGRVLKEEVGSVQWGAPSGTQIGVQSLEREGHEAPRPPGWLLLPSVSELLGQRFQGCGCGGLCSRGAPAPSPHMRGWSLSSRPSRR